MQQVLNKARGQRGNPTSNPEILPYLRRCSLVQYFEGWKLLKIVAELCLIEYVTESYS